MPNKPTATRDELLSDLAREFMMEPVHADEVTIAMMVVALEQQGVSHNEKTAVRILSRAVAAGKLAPPVKRCGPSGRTVLAWAKKV